jgi:hypothetical protein
MAEAGRLDSMDVSPVPIGVMEMLRGEVGRRDK